VPGNAKLVLFKVRSPSHPELDEAENGGLSPSSAEPSSNPTVERIAPLLRLLWQRRRFIARVTAMGLVASVLVAFLIPKEYESTTRLMPPDNDSRSGLAMLAALSGKGSDMSGLAGSLLGMKSSGSLFIGVLHSRTLQYRLIDRFNLQKVYSKRYKQDAAKELDMHTAMSEDRKTGIIAIMVTDKDPQRAAQMASAYVEELDRLVSQLATSAARRERVFLEQRLKDVRADLESAEKDLSQFSSKHATIDIKEQGKAMVEAVATLQGNLIAAQSQIEGLKQIYTDDNVRVRSVRARIAELQRQLQNLGGAQNSAAKAAEGSESLYPSIRELPVLGVTFADLYRRTKVQEAVFEVLTQQYELAKVQEAREIPTVKVLDPANVPEKKSFPPRLQIIFFGTLLALLFVAAWELLRGKWASVDPADPNKLLVLKVYDSVARELHTIRVRRAPSGD
jgi:uncharacterized protein involved in exopolysaccharide biosynthesis